MAVYRGPGGVWRVEFQLAGIRVHRSAKTRDKRAAQAFEAKLREQVHERRVLRRPAAPCSLTLGEACERYMAEHVRPSSRNPKKEEWLGRTLPKLLGAHRELGEITSADVAALKARLIRAGKAKGTANRHLAYLQAVMRKAWREWEAIPSVPVFKLFRLQNARTRVLTVDEEARLFRAAEANRALWRLLRFLLATGARLGEAQALTWERVVLENGGRRPHAVFLHTKNGDTRSVPLAPAIVEMLRAMKADPESAADPHVFLCWADTRDGRRLGSYRRPNEAFDRAREKAGIPDFRIHDLRHTCASRLVQRGVPLYTVGKLLGHRDPRMTARYSHLAEDGLDELADLL